MTTTQLPYMASFPALAGLAANNPALDEALTALAGFRENERGQGVLDEATAAARATVLKASANRRALVQRVVAAAVDGKPVSTALIGQAAEVESAVVEASAGLSVLADAGSQLAGARDALLIGAPDVLLGCLDGQLQAVLDAARSLDLGSVDSAQAAIEADRADGWQQYLDLTERHQVIRVAARLIAAHLLRDTAMAQHSTSFGSCRNYGELFPAWYDAQRRIPTGTVNGERVFPAPPWDEDSPAGLWAYAVQHPEAQLWVPTPAELHAVYAAARTEAQQVEDARSRDDDGQRLTDDETRRLRHHRSLVMTHTPPDP